MPAAVEGPNLSKGNDGEVEGRDGKASGYGLQSKRVSHTPPTCSLSLSLSLSLS